MNNIKIKKGVKLNNTPFNGEIAYRVDTDEVYGFANGIWVELPKWIKDASNLDNIVYNITTNKFQQCIDVDFVDLH